MVKFGSDLAFETSFGGRFSNYNVNFLKRRLIRLSVFFLSVSFGSLDFWEIIPFCLHCWIHTCKLCSTLFSFSCLLGLIDGPTPLLLIIFFSLLFFVSLARDLSILLIFFFPQELSFRFDWFFSLFFCF